ncbi:MAG: phasin family protein [Steroidobacteraceae bacterium]
MTDKTFDPNVLITATREAFAPVLKAQQEGFKALERLARLQYAFAGDVMESGLARVNATLIATTATELLNKQSELSSQFADRLRARAQEFATCTSEIQAKFAQLGEEITAKAVPARKAA